MKTATIYNATTTLPKRDTEVQSTDESKIEFSQSGYMVIVYDNDRNTVDEVIQILMEATACGIEEAVQETMEVHHLGKSVVHHSGKHECDFVAMVIRTIGIRVEVVEEQS